MGLFDQFPYTNFHELNLAWILEALKEIKTTTEQFVAINSLKYANPIQWNITNQYEKNTIVIDPLTGTAYISVQPVPIGAALTNTDYWTVVFDLERFVIKANNNFTPRVEPATTLNATFDTAAGQWVIWGGDLYRAITNITTGDQYTIGSNIQRITIEEVKNEILALFNGMIGSLADLNTQDKSNLVAAINEVLMTVATNIGSLADLNTQDKSNLVAAINEVLYALHITAGDLNDLNTQDKTNLVAAINEVNSTGGGAIAKIGNLEDLTTDDKSNTVAAINEVKARTDTNAADIVTLNGKIRDISTRVFLFVGDSYGDDQGEWPGLVIQNLNLGTRGINLARSGAGFISGGEDAYKFITQIKDYAGDRLAVTDIVICGGLNDSFSDDPLNAGYVQVQNAMGDFDVYAKANYPNAKISLGYIGNGNDYAPGSLISGRTYAARNVCRYIYYNMAQALGWDVLHNVEYALCTSIANIASDGVHPSIHGSQTLAGVIAGAILTQFGMALYPIYSLAMTADDGTVTSNSKFDMDNATSHIKFNNTYKTVNQGVTINGLTSYKFASIGALGFNIPISYTSIVRLDNFTIDGVLVTRTYAPCRMTLSEDGIFITLDMAKEDGTGSVIESNGSIIVLEEHDLYYDSMVMV